MNPELQLRLATIHDVEVLLEWRNDIETRRASHNMNPVERIAHIEWLRGMINGSDHRLYIAEEFSVPVGTVRADFSTGVWELSWTVSPNARGRGIAKKMVGEVAAKIKGPIRAEVKVGNQRSARVAQNAGMQLVRELDGVLHFERAKQTMDR